MVADSSRRLRLGAFGLGVVLAGAIIEQARAADTESAALAGEIVVTATKREARLADVPVSVAVVEAETIRSAHILDLADLATLVPSLRVNRLQSTANTNFSIRGFGNGANNAGIEPSVGLFVDGVYRSRSAAMIGDLPDDLARVEVLRGPQSTLFGKNASAGVISIVTVKPADAFGGHAELSYGNRDAVVARGLVTGPIGDGLAASLGGIYDRRDGFDRDLGTGNRTNNRNRWGLRGQLLYASDAVLSVRLIADYGRIAERCCAAVNLRPSAATGAIVALGGQVDAPDQRYDGVAYDNLDSTNRITDRGVSGQVDYRLGTVTLTSITAWRRNDAVTNQDSDFTSADLLQRNFQDVRLRTFTQELRATAKLGDRVDALFGAYLLDERTAQANQVQYGSQFRDYADLLVRGQTSGAQSVPALERLFGALAGNPGLYVGRFFGAGQGLDEAYRLHDRGSSVFGQLDGRLTDRLTLTGGIAYTNDRKRFTTAVVSSDVFAAISLPAMVQAATTVGIAQQIGALLGGPGGSASAAQVDAFASTQPSAYQAIATGVAARTRPFLSLRALQIFPPFLNVPNAIEPGRTRNGAASYTASLAYALKPRARLYARFATGFKASSVNLSRDSRPAPGDIAAIVQQGLGLLNLATGSRFAGPERTTLYEIGAKASWGALVANVAVFRQSIRGFQSNVFTGTGFFLTNAGRQSVIGVEFDGTAHPVTPLTLTLAVTGLRPRYDSFKRSAVGDLSGTRPGAVTPLAITVGASWEALLGHGARLVLAGDFHHEARFKLIDGLGALATRDPLSGTLVDATLAIAAAREFAQSINLLDASATLSLANRLTVSAWARNLLNNRNILQIFDSPAQQGSISGYPNQPRTYGLSLRFDW